MKTSHLLLIALASGLISILAISSCNKDNESISNPIEEIKGGDWQSRIGEEVSIEAILSLDPVPQLLFDFDDMNKNQNIPEARYMRLSVPALIMRDIPETWHGARVMLRGKIAEDPSGEAEGVSAFLGDNYRCILDVVAVPEVITPSVVSPPHHYDLCEANPAICDQLTIGERQTYVMLYSGGINSSKAYTRYWNDIVFMHFTLTWLLGVDASNIKVVYKNGVGEDGFAPVDYAASITGLNNAFSWFQSQMGVNDRFILFATNHGGNNISDTNNDEISGEDECFYYYNDGALLDDYLAQKVNNMTFGSMIAILEPCFGGGELYDLRGPGRVLMSASTENQVSWGGLTNYGNSYDHFVFYFTSALAGQYPDGTVVDADTDNNGKVSMAEAFEYARVADTADEIPQIESDGDGIPHSTVAGESGSLAQSFYIN